MLKRSGNSLNPWLLLSVIHALTPPSARRLRFPRRPKGVQSPSQTDGTARLPAVPIYHVRDTGQCPMRINIVGGGPAGLYFSILMMRQDPHHEITIYERNRADDTFGFGVVFSDAALDSIAEAEPDIHAEITKHFYHWD